jgi:predicted TPR repeat methyltransferase
MSIEIILNQANILLDEGKSTQAEALYRQILDTAPFCDKAWYGLGWTALKKESYENAACFFEKAHRIKPDEDAYTFCLANALQEEGFFQEAVSLYDSLPHIPESLVNKGIILSQQGKDAEAESVFQTLLAQQADFLPALLNLALLYRKTGQQEKALSLLMQICQKAGCFDKERSKDAFLNLSSDWKIADSMEDKASTDKEAWEYLFQLAVQYRLSKQADKAVFLYERALLSSCLSDKADMWDEYGLSLMEMARQEKNEQAEVPQSVSAQKALKAFETAEKLDGYFAKAVSHQGEALAFLGKKYEAEAAYKKALLISDKDTETFHNLGVLLSDMQRYQEALEMYRRVILLKPNFLPTLLNLAFLVEKSGDEEEAVGLYLKILALVQQRGEKKNMEQKGFQSDKTEEFSVETLEKIPFYLAAALVRLAEKDRQKAVLYAKTWAQNFPEDRTAQYTKKALCVQNSDTVPAKEVSASLAASYAESFYDAFAPSYEMKMRELDCRVPEKLAKLVQMSAKSSSVFQKGLDLGCGTGAGAAAFLDKTADFTGVDISEKMLSLADKKKIYSRLIHQDILSFLKKTNDLFDLVISSEGLCYIDNLQEVFSLVAEKMKAGGLFVASIEKNETNDESRVLLPSGRFAYHRKQVEEALTQSNFEILCLTEESLRREKTGYAKGFLFVGKKRPD